MQGSLPSLAVLVILPIISWGYMSKYCPPLPPGEGYTTDCIDRHDHPFTQPMLKNKQYAVGTDCYFYYRSGYAERKICTQDLRWSGEETDYPVANYVHNRTRRGIGETIDEVKEGVKGLGETLDSVGETVQGHVSSVVDTVNQGVDHVVGAVGQVTGQVNGVIDNVNGAVNNVAGQVNGVINNVNGVVTNVGNQVNGAINSVNGVVDNAANQVNGIINNVNQGINDITSTINNVASTVNNVAGAINAIGGGPRPAVTGGGPGDGDAGQQAAGGDGGDAAAGGAAAGGAAAGGAAAGGAGGQPNTGVAIAQTVQSIVRQNPGMKQSKAGSAISGALSGAAMGFQVGGPWGAVIGGVVGLLGGLFGGGKQRQTVKIVKEERDKIFPEIQCPPDVEVLNDPGQLYATVTSTNAPNWQEPIIATDNQVPDGIKANRIGLGLNEQFPMGSTQVGYFATDPHGNPAYCGFTVTVKVPRCGPVGPTDYGSWYCPMGDMNGGRCKLTCLPGFEMSGSDIYKCNGFDYDPAKWVGGPSKCDARSCDAPEVPQHVILQCSANYTYNSACAYTCKPGYGPIDGAVNVRICTIDKNINEMVWTGRKGGCKDITPPVLQCPEGVITKFAEPSETKAFVTWPKINVTDNSGEVITPLLQTIDYGPDQYFEEGYYDIRYVATDSQGNKGQCVFAIRVAVIYCHRLANLPLGRIDCNGVNYGSKCQFSCGLGYELQGSNTTECLQNPAATARSNQRGIWSQPMPTCKALTCPAIPAPDHGFTKDDCSSKEFGQFCSLGCDDGYDLMGTTSRRCLAEQNALGLSTPFWDGKEGMCEVRTCKTLYTPLNGHNLTDCGPRPVYGSVCSFGCNKGFRMLGEPTNTCLKNGRWKFSAPTCQAKTCDSGLIPAPINGYKSGCPNHKERVGTVCKLVCNHGYQPQQPVLSECVDNGGDFGEWSNKTFECKPVECPSPVVTGSGSIEKCIYKGLLTDVTSSQRFGTVCSYKCSNGYTGFGTFTRKCRASGVWDGEQPVCRDVTPPLLQCPSSRVMFAEEGKRTVKLPWDWEPIRAQDGDKKIVAQLIEVNSVSVKGNKPKSLAEGQHVLKYQAVDEAGQAATCTFQIDVKVTRCPPLLPPSPPFGELQNLEGQGTCALAVFGTVCRQTCQLGFDFIGDTPSRRCRRASKSTTVGYWDGVVGRCKPKSCDVPKVDNGYVSGCPVDQTTVNSVCSFVCDRGFQSPLGVTEVKRRCNGDGTWSGDDLVCQSVKCSGPFSIPHGNIKPASCMSDANLSYGTTCIFTCNDGYLQYGSYSKQCLETGTWSNTRSTTCVDNMPPQFDSPCPRYVDAEASKGSASAVVSWTEPTATDNSFNVTLIRQPPQYKPGSRFPEGVTTVTYIATDKTGHSAQCDVYVKVKAIRCPRIPAPLYGAYDQCSGSTPYGATCSFKCNQGYMLSGSTVRTCEYDKVSKTTYWTGSDTKCTIVTCPALPTPRHAVKSGCVNNPPGTEKFGTVCNFYCRYGYQEIGDPVSRCKEDGTWTGGNLQCEVQSCPALADTSDYKVEPASCKGQPQFLQTCVYSCRKPGYRLLPRGNDFVTCLANGRWTRDISNIRCEDVERPHFTSCPSDIYTTADKGTESVFVSWDIPTATDNSGETPVMTSNLSPSRFSAGTHHVTYTATDKAGNKQHCDFSVIVSVRRCPRYQPPVYGRFVGACKNSFGSQCTVTCVDGYKLVGSSSVTCEYSGNSGYWQFSEQPRCEIVGCPALTPPANGFLYPAFCGAPYTPYHGTSCSFYCNQGFALRQPRDAVVCGQDGRWEGDSTTAVCQDHTPPVLRNCPGPQTVILNGDSLFVSAVWDLPTATDNSKLPLRVVVKPEGVAPPHNFTKTTNVTYTFYDSANNSVTCQFTVFVKEEVGPKVKYCPSGISTITEGTTTVVTWKMPEFELPNGVTPLVQPTSNSGEYGWGNHTIIYSATNPVNGKTSFCTFHVLVEPKPCPSLQPPVNGALSCNNWAFGKFCSILCNEKFDIPRGITSHSEFNCGASGLWIPTNQVPDCVEPRDAISRLPSELHYFTGDCSSPATKEQIKNNFIQILHGSVFKDRCTTTDDCKPENVQVVCGPASRLGGRRKRSTLQHVAKIKFDLQLSVKTSSSRTNPLEIRRANRKLFNIAVALGREVKRGSRRLDLNTLPNQVDRASFKRGRPRLTCESQDLTLSDLSMKCVSCPVGTRFNPKSTLTSKCDPCRAGTYQDNSGKRYCKRCPEGTSTIAAGARKRTECIGICPAGTFSTTGLESCSPCPKGEYQPDDGSKQCLSCPDGTTTVNIGAKSASQCIAKCPAGSYSTTGVVPCDLCPMKTFQPQSGQTDCLSCSGKSVTLKDGSVSDKECIDIDECLSSPCKNQGQCIDLIDGYRCDCLPGWTGDQCQTNIDDCESQPCGNNATCVDGVDSYTCQCLPGYTGKECFIDIDECANSPCANNGTCVDQVNGFQCLCQDGFDGSTCKNQIDMCASNPCKHGSTCIPLVNDFKCVCRRLYTGKQCEVSLDHCRSGPCQNGGSCTSSLTSYRCSCGNGYAGAQCEVKVDLCKTNPCQSGGTCHDLGDDFACSCQAGRYGKRCEKDLDPCIPNPCRNKGSCTGKLKTDEYTCSCPLGFAGVNCEVNIDDCATQPCSGGATCVDLVNDYKCLCPGGFSGKDCDIAVQNCNPDPCKNGGTCEDEVGQYKCLCPPGFSGQNCDLPADRCSDSPCLNGGSCHKLQGGDFKCICQEGFVGKLCDRVGSPCTSDPCSNDGVCEEDNGKFKCTCKPGYTGNTCETNIDDCASKPCLNGASCVDKVNSYMCLCAPGYTGKNCDTVFHYCVPGTCANGASCVDSANGFKCICPPGKLGLRCDENQSKCGTYPCVHATGCTDLSSGQGYQCSCESGWSGVNCDINVDECQSSPCAHGGTCVDLVDGYQCDCRPGFTGDNCETNIDECASNPCGSSSSCLDLINSYKCICNPGLTGALCDIPVDDCDSSPCLNGGVCQDLDQDYSCTCQTGFSGKNCEINIDDCNGVTCENGGTCVDQANDFDCICKAGYSGRYCSTDACTELKPCLNGATCKMNKLGTYTCECPPGFTGEQCETDINDCSPNPCDQGARCTDLVNDFKCDCPPGFSGKTCNINIDDCADSPCGQGSTCVDGVNEFTCVCAPGYLGTLCEKKISSRFDVQFLDKKGKNYIFLDDVMSGKQSDILTIQMWVRTTGEGTIMSYGTDAGNQLQIDIRYNGLYIYVFRRTIFDATGMLLRTGNWHKLTVVIDQPSVTVYIDGKFMSTGPNNNGPFTKGDLVIGYMQQMQGGKLVLTSPYTGDLSRLNIWDRALTKAEIENLDCQSEDSVIGNVVAWGDVNYAIKGELQITQPTECDAVNDCIGNPCQNGGACHDLVGQFKCDCPVGFAGDRCSQNIDDCKDNMCSNGATCVDGIGDYTCACTPGYEGHFCQEKIVNGGWSSWTTWTVCTKTCATGTQTRSRVCDNPPPSKNGKPCSGTTTQAASCNKQACPSCIPLSPPVDGFVHCTKTGDVHECAASCKPGYNFDGIALDKYICSPNTSFLWNHQGKVNPRALLPSCGRTTPPRNISLDLSIRYPYVYYNCEKVVDARILNGFATRISQLSQNISCIQSGICSLDDIEVGRCVNVTDGGFYGVFSYVTEITGSDLSQSGGNFTKAYAMALNRLQPAAKKVQEQLLNGGFAFEVAPGKFLNYDPNSLIISGSYQCEPGSVSSNNTCVLCPRGTFWDNGVCTPCAVGSYQDVDGQTDCKPCPGGKYTQYTGTYDVTQCTVSTIPTRKR